MRRRREEERSFASYFQTFLSWLSEEQRNELKAMKDAGQDRANLLEKTVSILVLFFKLLSHLDELLQPAGRRGQGEGADPDAGRL